jgi:bifunctional DNase/RNase
MHPVLIRMLLFVLIAMSAGASLARELAVNADELVAVELASVGVVPILGTPVVLLREPESGNIVPIFIGPNEARAIIMAQRGIEAPRPMTHDLLINLMESMGGTLERVVVDELSNGTYHGALEVLLADGNMIRIDSRPSDALAMAVRSGAAILVAPAILEAGEDIPFEGLGDDDIVTALGITVMSVTPDLRQALQLPDQPGVLISSVRGMAQMAGLQPGALIVKVNDQTPATPLTFLELVNDTETGEKAKVEYWHDGEFQTVELGTDVDASTPRTERRRSL